MSGEERGVDRVRVFARLNSFEKIEEEEEEEEEAAAVEEDIERGGRGRVGASNKGSGRLELNTPQDSAPKK